MEINEDDFEYDDFDNLIVDRNKKINEISYNHLNLSKKIVFETGEITYFYDVIDIKFKKNRDGKQQHNQHVLIQQVFNIPKTTWISFRMRKGT